MPNSEVRVRCPVTSSRGFNIPYHLFEPPNHVNGDSRTGRTNIEGLIHNCLFRTNRIAEFVAVVVTERRLLTLERVEL